MAALRLGCHFTVTVHVAVLEPSTVLTVMVATPTATRATVAGVTVVFKSISAPSLLTVATLGLLLVQMTFWLVALAGAIVALRGADVLVESRSIAVLSHVTPVTGTLFTVTVHVAVLPPSTVVAVMVAVPPPLPVTMQGVSIDVVNAKAGSTNAIVLSLLFQKTFLFVALVGWNVAMSVSVPSTKTEAVAGNVTPVTGTFTVTMHVFVKPPSCVRTVMVAVPPPLPVTLPVLSTVAILSLLLNQVTFLFVGGAGPADWTVAVRVSVSSLVMVVEVLFNSTPVTGSSFTVTAHVAVLLPS